MKIKLLEVSLDPQQLQLGTCEVCFSVEFAQFPTFKFEIDESATEYVEMYAYHEPYKVAYYGMDVDVDILQPELTQALDKIVGLLK